MRDMKLYRTADGALLDCDGNWHRVQRPWEELLNDDDLYGSLERVAARGDSDDEAAHEAGNALAPIGRQEVWACGVTYYRSRNARMEESRDAGGGDFYERVYDAERPELFFKATPERVVGPGEAMHLRRDSRWMVPEPELVLVVTRTARIIGFTIGNDLSCRDIEGENPLYLPQAKTFDRCAALGPCIRVMSESPAPDTRIILEIRRGDAIAFRDETTLAQLKRSPAELVGWLFRDNAHPAGCFLMTGTGIVPDNDFSLRVADEVAITIDGIGTLVNPMG